MHGEADVLEHRIEIAALDRRRGDAQERVRGDENEQIERRLRSRPAPPAHGRSSDSGRLLPKAATRPPASARIATHSSIEPSWLPQTPVTL